MKLIKIIIGLLMGLLAVSVITAVLIWSWLQPVQPGQSELTRFTIPKGQSITKIADRLADAGLIKQPLAFRVWVKIQGLSQSIQAGSFELSPGMTLPEVTQKLTEGTDDIWITMIEGWRVEEVAQMLARQELADFDETEFLDLAKPYEGQLFPDTYLIPRLSDAESILDLLLTTYEKRVTQGLADELSQAETQGRSAEQILVMASILEREAQGLDDMRHVAGILYHRLELGMPLQADATLQYVKGYNSAQDDWWVPPTAADKQLQSPFNTYLNPGLPPRPIASPGLEAIEAALTPLDTNHLFYIHDRQGNIHYAVDIDGHNANVAKYLR